MPSENSSTSQRALAQHWTSLVVAIACALYVAVPLLAPALIIGCAAVTHLWVRIDGSHGAPLARAAVLPVAALVAWFGFSLLWTPNRSSAIGALSMMLLTVSSVLVVAACVDQVARDVRRQIALGFVIGLALGMWLLLEEHLSGYLARRMVHAGLSALGIDAGSTLHLDRATGGLPGYVTNKSTAAALLLLWPWLLVSATLATRPSTQALRFATLLALLAAVALSEHEASKLALVASAIVYLVTRLSRAVAFAFLAAGWVAATLAILPASMLAYRAGAYRIEAIQYSGRHRLVIWGATADRALRKPITGYGLASTRFADGASSPDRRHILPGTDLPAGVNVHSHNVFLQTWQETGLPGALLMFLSGLPLLAWVRTRPAETAPSLNAGFAAAVVVASLSWSLVAPWYIATFGLVACWLLFADIVGRSGATRSDAALSVK